METRSERPDDGTSDRESHVSFAAELQDTLVREAYHRVKNSLQLVGGLLRMQSRRTDCNVAKVQLESACQRVFAVAGIYDMLSSKSAAKIPMQDCLTRLCASFSSVKETGISLDLAADEIFLEADRALPLCLLASEAIANCLKHAFVDRRTGSIKVEMWKCGDGMLRLDIQDDGVGRAQSATEGMGSRLLRELSTQLHGRLVRSADPGKGYTVSVYVRE